MQKFLTWKQLQELGHPYSRQYTGRLERAGDFPLRRRLRRRVIWVAEEYEAWQKRWLQQEAQAP